MPSSGDLLLFSCYFTSRSELGFDRSIRRSSTPFLRRRRYIHTYIYARIRVSELHSSVAVTYLGSMERRLSHHSAQFVCEHAHACFVRGYAVGVDR